MADYLLYGRYSFNTISSSVNPWYPSCFHRVLNDGFNAELSTRFMGFQYSFPDELAATVRKAGFSMNVTGGKQYWMGYTSFIISNHGGIPFWQWSRAKCRTAADTIPDVDYVAFDVEWNTSAMGPYYDNVNKAAEQTQRYVWIFERLRERNPNVGCFNWFHPITFRMSNQGQKLFSPLDYSMSEITPYGLNFYGRDNMEEYLGVYNPAVTKTLDLDSQLYFTQANLFQGGYGYRDMMWPSSLKSEDPNVTNRSSQIVYLSCLDQEEVRRNLFPNTRHGCLAWPVQEPGVEYSMEASPNTSNQKIVMISPTGTFTITDKPRYDPTWWEDMTLEHLFHTEVIYFWEGRPPVRKDKAYAFSNTAQCALPGNVVTGVWEGEPFACPTPLDGILAMDAEFVDAASRAAHRYKQLGENFLDGATRNAITCEYVMGVDARINPANAAAAANVWNGLANKKVLPAYTDGRHFNRSAQLAQPYVLRYTKTGNNNRVLRLKSPFEHPGLSTWFRLSDGADTYYLRTRGNRTFVDTYTV